MNPIENERAAGSATLARTQTTAAEDRSAKVAVTIFPLIIIVAFLIAFIKPGAVQPFAGYVTPALGIIMFGMGLTLTAPDFKMVAKRPLPILIGVVSQFVIMPLLGVALAWIFNLPPELAAGVVLVGAAPGGTSSNVISYLAKGDVALSVTMTTISTLLAPIFTPLLTLWLAGSWMDVSASAMAMSIVKIVIIPVVGGLLVRTFAGKIVEKVLPALPWISVLGIAYVVMAVVSGSADKIVEAGAIILVVVILHNGLGYALGYAVAHFTGSDRAAARTTSVEVGMQNSGLAAGLAAMHLTPEAALPAAVFSVWHNISGGLYASMLLRLDTRRERKEA
ncbi:MAG: bile acid:sodium symporter family protein [Actinomycetaceae bacterium]|nr:bile acid:sodium symporter family protein [Actinomycetaceae bacterium]